MPDQPGTSLSHFAEQVASHRRLFVLTGAGISAASGIPTYRDDGGAWRGSEPVLHQEFIEHVDARQRYWRRSYFGWPAVAEAKPNTAHRYLGAMERAGRVGLLVTQNVDGLHQAAGQHNVVDLHGRLDRVKCLGCDWQGSRAGIQTKLRQLNPGLPQQSIRRVVLPDGDAEVEAAQPRLEIPACSDCGGTLMPDVVFFGGSVPKQRVEKAKGGLHKADAVLVIGSSLSVFSGFRFCRLAHQLDKPLYIVNRGVTRADELATGKVTVDCDDALAAVCAASGVS